MRDELNFHTFTQVGFPIAAKPSPLFEHVQKTVINVKNFGDVQHVLKVFSEMSL